MEEKDVFTLQVSVIYKKAVEGHCIPSESRKMTVSSGARPSAIFLDSFTPA
ncbi:MAG: hypothetical protein R3F50_18835 [Gammaproteobacteria bacterium]